MASVFGEAFLRLGHERIWSECIPGIKKEIEYLKQTKYDESVDINE